MTEGVLSGKRFVENRVMLRAVVHKPRQQNEDEVGRLGEMRNGETETDPGTGNGETARTGCEIL